MTPHLRSKMSGAATELGRLLKYEGAGTVEFIVDAKTGGFYFLEVNTRVQVLPVRDLVTTTGRTSHYRGDDAGRHCCPTNLCRVGWPAQRPPLSVEPKATCIISPFQSNGRAMRLNCVYALKIHLTISFPAPERSVAFPQSTRPRALKSLMYVTRLASRPAAKCQSFSTP